MATYKRKSLLGGSHLLRSEPKAVTVGSRAHTCRGQSPWLSCWEAGLTVAEPTVGSMTAGRWAGLALVQ